MDNTRTSERVHGADGPGDEPLKIVVDEKEKATHQMDLHIKKPTLF